jgi:hypothetical protein
MNLSHIYHTQRLATLAAFVFLMASCAPTNDLAASETHAPTPELFTEPRSLSPKSENADIAPARLEIERLNISMPAMPVGLEADGAMEIPDDVMTVGHYDPDGLGVQPGAAGTAVFAGHVDSRTQGRGALYELSSLSPGDTISVTAHDGSETLWRVSEVTTYRKEAMPMADIFTFSGPSRIAVITCGGTFDRATRSYTHNVVVLAEPVVAAAAA